MKKLNTIHHQILVQKIKRHIMPHENVAERIAKILDIQPEGAYRRLRGDTPFSLTEALCMVSKLGISIDALVKNTEQIHFKTYLLCTNPHQIEDYFKDILARFKKLDKVPKTNTTNVCEDLPFFRQFGYPNLTAFKLFYWQESVLRNPAYDYKKYNPNEVSKNLRNLAKQVYDAYLKTESTEIWTLQTIVKTYQQIDYYLACGMFNDLNYLQAIYCDLEKLLIDLIADAKAGFKLTANKKIHGKFTLYWSELSLDNNSIFLKTSKPRYLALGSYSFNSIQTIDHAMLQDYQYWLNSIINKSIKISGQSEKMRFQFYSKNLQLMKKLTNNLSLT